MRRTICQIVPLPTYSVDFEVTALGKTLDEMAEEQMIEFTHIAGLVPEDVDPRTMNVGASAST